MASGHAGGGAHEEESNPPQSTPKRARDDGPWGISAGGDQPPTLALLQQALQVNQQQITNSLHESLEGLGKRVGTLEQNLDQHVERTTQLLDAMTNRHVAIEHSARNVDSSYEDVRRRLDLLEGKFATASFCNTNTGSRTTDTGGHNGSRPAVIMGARKHCAWSNSTSRSSRLTSTCKMLSCLAFVADLRWYRSLPETGKHKAASTAEFAKASNTSVSRRSLLGKNRRGEIVISGRDE